MAWVYLLIAGVFEIVWAVGLKYAEGFTRLVPSTVTVVAMILSVVFLSLAVKSLPVGTAYALWTGIGAAGTAVCGMILFGEPHTSLRVFALMLIVAGIVVLKIAS